MKNFKKTCWIVNGIVIICAAYLLSCSMIKPDIPWEQRWAQSYCMTTDWEKLNIPADQISILCNLSAKYQVTLNEAQGIVFMTVLLASLPDPEDTVPVIAEYTIKLKEYVTNNTGVTLADLFLKVMVDSENPRYHIVKQLLNIGIIETWGRDPLANFILNDKDKYFLNAHFDNILFQIGYNPKV